VSAFYRYARECLALFGIDLLAYVLMSNHFHFVIRSPAEELFQELTTRRLRCRHRRPWPAGHQKRSVRAQFMRKLMHSTSTTIQRHLDLSGHFWERSYHARRVLDETDLVVTMAYDHMNPVEAGMARIPDEYRRSSASWWRRHGESVLPLLQRPLPFGLALPELRARLLEYQGAERFCDAMAEFEASGGALGSWEGLEALKTILRDRGIVSERGPEVRTSPPQPVARQQLASAEGCT
jgi:REP element-mobilizing transposase RayT